MSQQIQITGGAKVRNLEGVLTGTAGVVNALGINVPSGIPQLDGSGKILVSQLPNSVMEYKGTWNAATNTPTLVNGTGNQGDVYLCNVAGTVNFGAGAITFAVGDQAIYSGTIWQKAGGSTGTVTSVAVTETGDALTITGSPITTSGTINIGFAGTSGQYVNGAGGLTTFPSLTGYVPYTGATANVDLGTFDLTADIVNANDIKALTSAGLDIYSNSGTHIALMGGGGGAGTTFYGGIVGTTGSFASSGGSDTFAINHSSGSGIALNITKGGAGEGLYINKTSGSGNAATIIGTLNATTLVKSGGTSTEFLKADGSVDSNSYVTLTTNQNNISGTKSFTSSAGTGFEYGIGILKNNTPSGFLPSTYIQVYCEATANNIVFRDDLSKAKFIFNNSTQTFTFPAATGTIALTSDIPSLSGYVPYTGATANVNIGNNLISSASIQLNGDNTSNFGYLGFKQFSSGSSGFTGYTSIYAQSTNKLGISYSQSGGGLKTAVFSSDLIPLNSALIYRLPASGGDLALTSDLSSYLPLTGGTLSGALNINLGSGTGLNVSTENVVFRSSPAYGSPRQLVYTMGSGPTITLEAKGYGANYITDFNIITHNASGTAFNVFFGTAQGDVGIGNTAPAAKLDVTGTGRFTGSLTATSGIYNPIDNVTDTIRVYRGNTAPYLNESAIFDAGGGMTNIRNKSLDTVRSIIFSFSTDGSTSYTERMRITSGGSLGLGTTSPFNPGGGGQTSFEMSGTNYSTIYLSANSATVRGQIGADNLNAWVEVGARTNHPLLLITNNTERMRITSDGRILAGATATDSGCKFRFVFNGITQNGLQLFDETNNTASCIFHLFGINNPTPINIGAILRASNTNAVLFSTTSDYRLKEDYKQINGLDKVLAIKVYDFKWKGIESRMDGVIAHELAEVLPYAVNGEKDAIDKDGNEFYQGVDYSKIVPILVKAIQELKAEIDELKNK